MRRGTPKASMDSIARGNAASDVLVAKAMVAGSATACTKRPIGSFANHAMGSSTHSKKDGQRGVSGEQQFAERQQHADSHVRDGVSHRGADADRRVIHHDIGERKHHVRQRFAEFQHGGALRFRDARERNSKKDGEHRHLQDLVFRDGLREIFREDVQKEIVPVHRRGVLRGHNFRRGGHGHAFTGAADIDGAEADEQRHGCDQLKINQALDADASDAAEIAVAGDARDQRAQNQRRDDHFDQAQENIAEDAQVFGKVRAVQADFSAEEHGEENPVR